MRLFRALVVVTICSALPAWVHAAGEGAPAQQNGGGASLPGEGDQDRKFVESAYATLMPAVELSKLGAEKASDSEVVALSEKMAETYAELAKELESAAQSAAVERKEGEAPHVANRLDRLEDASSEFDLTYLTEQRGVHKKLTAIYTMEARAGENERLRSHADRGRQIFTDNANEIERLESRLSKARTSPGR